MLSNANTGKSVSVNARTINVKISAANILLPFFKLYVNALISNTTKMQKPIMPNLACVIK